MEYKKKGCKIFNEKTGFIVFLQPKTESVAQLVRASVCGTEGRGFETPRSPSQPTGKTCRFFYSICYVDYLDHTAADLCLYWLVHQLDSHQNVVPSPGT